MIIGSIIIILSLIFFSKFPAKFNAFIFFLSVMIIGLRHEIFAPSLIITVLYTIGAIAIAIVLRRTLGNKKNTNVIFSIINAVLSWNIVLVISEPISAFNLNNGLMVAAIAYYLVYLVVSILGFMRYERSQIIEKMIQTQTQMDIVSTRIRDLKMKINRVIPYL